MGKSDQGSGWVIQTDDGGGLKTMIFGWGAVALGIGIAVAAVVLANYLGLAVTIAAGGFGVALTAVGIGEGIRRARLGDAAKIEAKARMIEARNRDRLPPPY